MDNLWIIYDIWLVVEPTSLKNLNVSWGDDIPNVWKKMFQTTNQMNLQTNF